MDGIYAPCMVVHSSHLTLDTWVPWRINKLEALIVKSLCLSMALRDDSDSVAGHSESRVAVEHTISAPITDRYLTDHARTARHSSRIVPAKEKKRK